MNVKITPYELFLNIFVLAVLVGLGYFIWACGAGLEWYWRLSWIAGLFSAGTLLSWACAHGFGATAVYVINPNDKR